ncbi:MAG: CYTH domain-containing protein [Lachnospiraceae bacterium]|nr:CYTH domain-containing protein [Lachnospiraceae bacterium]
MSNLEIERKWLIEEIPYELSELECLDIEQAYLSSSPTVRVRKENDTYYLTYKGARGTDGNTDMVHTEYNLPLNKASYEHLKEKCDGIVLHKKRYIIPLENGLKIELDIFEGETAPLKLAEVEFGSEDEALKFKAPAWFGRDVTGDFHYKNVYLCKAMKTGGEG